MMIRVLDLLACGVMAIGSDAPDNPARMDTPSMDCADYDRIRNDAIAACAASGGTSISISGWCSDAGHHIETKCFYGMT